MLGSSGQELLLWELRLVQERLNLKNSGLLLKSEREKESGASIDSNPRRDDQVPEVTSDLVLESDDSNVDGCEEELEGVQGNETGSDTCNSVIYQDTSGGQESDGISEKTGEMDVLPQRSEVKRHYPVSIASDHFETMHLSEELSGEEEDHGCFVRNGFGRISTISSRSVGGAENFKVRKKKKSKSRTCPGRGGDHHIQKCQEGSQCQVTQL